MLKQEKNRIIELFGLPGAGKSTLAEYIASNHSSEYCVVSVNRIERFFYFSIFCIFYPFFVIHILRWVRASPKKVRRYIVHLFSVSASKTLKSLLYFYFSNKNFIIDEGIFQRILSVSQTVLSREDAIRHVSKIPKWSRRVLVVEGENFNRYTSSSTQSPRSALGDEYLNHWMGVQRENYILIRDILKNLPYLEAVSFDNTEKKDLNRSNLLGILKR